MTPYSGLRVLSISVMSKYVTRWRAPDPMLGALVVDIVGYGSRLRSAGELSADFLSFRGSCNVVR